MSATRRRQAKEAARFERCPTKIHYSTWQEAEEAAIVTINDLHAGVLKQTNHAGVLMAYRCDVCQAWHIGHFTSHVVRSAPSRDWGIG